MVKCDPIYTAHQLKRWMAPNAHHFVRPDWRRHVTPGSEAAALFELYERKYREDQLRDDHGRFADEGRGTSNRVRLASSDKPTLGRQAVVAVLAEMARRAIEAYRSENGLRDLFGRHDGTVSYTTINGKDIFGSNSTSPTYEASDRAAADSMRDILINNYPEVVNSENIGRMPNNALYHAETTALLRAAQQNGGTLSGQSLDILVDSEMCNNCDVVLPYLGLELGNPRVTFTDSRGARSTMHNGRWLSEERP
jgi:type II secretory pathway pseudopilin PulG